jgi:hypothetical protein
MTFPAHDTQDWRRPRRGGEVVHRDTAFAAAKRHEAHGFGGLFCHDAMLARVTP